MCPPMRINNSRHQGIKVGCVPLTIIHSGLPTECVLPVPMSLCFIGLEVLIPRESTTSIDRNSESFIKLEAMKLCVPLASDPADKERS